MRIYFTTMTSNSTDFVVRTKYKYKTEHIFIKNLSLNEYMLECKYNFHYKLSGKVFFCNNIVNKLRHIIISRQKKVWCKMESANIEINRSIWCYYSRVWFWKNCYKLLSQWQLVHKYQRYWCWKWKFQWFDHKFGKYNLIS